MWPLTTSMPEVVSRRTRVSDAALWVLDRGCFQRTQSKLPLGVLTTLLVMVLLAVPVVHVGADAVQNAADVEATESVVRETFVLDGPPTLTIDPPGRLTFGTGQRFVDTLEVLNTSTPMMVNDLSFDDYVAGIAEMPTRWPMEALKAQAVAARTYAWRAILRGTYSGYDICATVACQVFRGANAVDDAETGHRWREAVDATSGEVLIDTDGIPILARYFSTSGGRTYANQEVFPSQGSFDYLVGIDDPYDAASPVHRWQVSFRRDDFNDILSRGATLAATVPVAVIERVGAVDDPQATIAVTGINGRRVEVGAVAFRDFVSQVAASRFPDLYPPMRADGEAPLPATLPSSRFAVTLTADEVVIDGQGWGHGVGMGQYGALGRAEAGSTYDEILAAYYGGLEPVAAAELPERVRVGIGLQLPASIGGTTIFTISAPGVAPIDDALGTWTLDREGDRWHLQAPVGYGEMLSASATRLASEVPTMDDAVTVEVDVNKPVFLHLVVTGGSGTVYERELGVVDAGDHAYTWRFVDDDGQVVAPGEYDVMIAASDAKGARAGQPIRVTVPEPPREPEPPVSRPAGPGRAGAFTLSLPLAAALAAAGLLLMALALRRKGRQ